MSGKRKKNPYRAALNLIVELAAIGVVIKSAVFAELDEAYYLASLVMFLQAISFCLEKVDKDRYFRRVVSVSGIWISLLGSFICYAELWRVINLPANTWHIIVLVLLFLAEFRNFLEKVLILWGSLSPNKR